MKKRNFLSFSFLALIGIVATTASMAAAQSRILANGGSSADKYVINLTANDCIYDINSKKLKFKSQGGLELTYNFNGKVNADEDNDFTMDSGKQMTPIHGIQSRIRSMDKITIIGNGDGYNDFKVDQMYYENGGFKSKNVTDSGTTSNEHVYNMEGCSYFRLRKPIGSTTTVYIKKIIIEYSCLEGSEEV